MTDREVTLEVYGTPYPQGSKTGFVRGGKVIITEGKGPGRASHAAWRQAVATAARDWAEAHDPFPPLDGPVLVSIAFRLARPKSYPRWRWLPSSKPDLDKLARSVFDGVKGPVFVEDSRVAVLIAFETYVVTRAPGATIYLREISEAERTGKLSLPGFTITRDDETAAAPPDEAPTLPLPG